MKINSKKSIIGFLTILEDFSKQNVKKFPKDEYFKGALQMVQGILEELKK